LLLTAVNGTLAQPHLALGILFIFPQPLGK
jgi:hypothetical protein